MTGPVLVTGAAGFIGSALSLRLLERGERVVGIDNLNSQYDPQLKRARLARIEEAAAAATKALEEWVGFRPSTPTEEGVDRFAGWY